MEVKEADSKFLAPARRRPTELGALPADWDVIELATRATIQSGIAKNANAALRDPVAVPYLRVANVQDGYLDLREVALIEIERSDLNRYAVLPGDVLMNEGGDLDKLGRGALWHGQIDPCVHQNHVFVVRCKTGLVPEYLNAWTSTAQARRYFMLAGRQTTNLASINKTSLGELTVAVPPTESEQREIAEAISDTDALIDSLEQLLTKKRLIKQGAMQELLTGKRRLPGASGVWSVRRMREIAKLNRLNIVPAQTPGSAFTHFSLPAFDAGMTPSIDLGIEIGSNKFRVPHNAVLVSKLNPRIPRVWAPNGIPENAVASTEWLVLTPEQTIDRMFLYSVCRSPSFCEKMELAATGTTGSHQRISPATAMDIEVQLPEDVDEQIAIAQVLSDIDAEVVSLESRMAKASTLKQAMAQALLTGRIRLVEPSA